MTIEAEFSPDSHLPAATPSGKQGDTAQRTAANDALIELTGGAAGCAEMLSTFDISGASLGVLEVALADVHDAVACCRSSNTGCDRSLATLDTLVRPTVQPDHGPHRARRRYVAA
jgi:hypothetical protein